MESSDLPPTKTPDTRDIKRLLSTAEMARVGFLGNSPGLRHAVARLKQFATTRLPFLILGETGTGKEVAARAVHHWSGCRGALVDVNCGALPRELVEGELFGHRQGAYTGALKDSPGLIEAARNGTLFLDEVGSLPPEAQAKILRVVEAGEVRRLGETRNRKVRFRLVAAGHARLLDDRRLTFREDLVHRLGGVVVTLPPLRERGRDAELIAAHYARAENVTLAPSCGPMLRNHSWRGNVRELRGVIMRASVLASDAVITPEVLESAFALGAPDPGAIPSPSDPAWAQHEVYLRECIALRWSATMIAKDSGVHRSTVYRWLKAHDLQGLRSA